MPWASLVQKPGLPGIVEAGGPVHAEANAGGCRQKNERQGNRVPSHSAVISNPLQCVCTVCACTYVDVLHSVHCPVLTHAVVVYTRAAEMAPFGTDLQSGRPPLSKSNPSNSSPAREQPMVCLHPVHHHGSGQRLL